MAKRLATHPTLSVLAKTLRESSVDPATLVTVTLTPELGDDDDDDHDDDDDDKADRK